MSNLDPFLARRAAAELKMRRLKLEAVEKGEGLDFCFLVGAEKEVREKNFSYKLLIWCNADGALLEIRPADGQRVLPEPA